MDPSGCNPTFGDPYIASSDSIDVFHDVCDVCDVIISEPSAPESETPIFEATTTFVPVLFFSEAVTATKLAEGLSLAGKAGLAVGAAKGALIAGTAIVFYEMGTEIGEPIAVPLATGIAFVYVKAETVYTWASDSVKDAWERKERARKAERRRARKGEVGHTKGKKAEKHTKAGRHSSRKRQRKRLLEEEE